MTFFPFLFDLRFAASIIPQPVKKRKSCSKTAKKGRDHHNIDNFAPPSGAFYPPNSRRTAQAAARNPAASAHSAAGTAYRVLPTFAAPKYTATV